MDSDQLKKNQDKQAEAIAKEFFQSEKLAQMISESIELLQPSPLQAAFALAIVDRFLDAQVKDWTQLKKFAELAVQKMQQEGAAPNIGRDGKIRKMEFPFMGMVKHPFGRK